MKNIRKEMMEIKGADFNDWYKGLTSEEKTEYSSIIEELRRK